MMAGEYSTEKLEGLAIVRPSVANNTQLQDYKEYRDCQSM